MDHIIQVTRPRVGSLLYMIYVKAIKQNLYYYDFVTYQNGVLVPFERVDIPCNYFKQGNAADQFGNKEVEHAYKDGEILLVPNTDKSLKVKIYPNGPESNNVGTQMALSISMAGQYLYGTSSYYLNYYNKTWGIDVLFQTHPLSYNQSSKYRANPQGNSSEGACTITCPDIYSGKAQYTQYDNWSSTTIKGITTSGSTSGSGTVNLIFCGKVLNRVGLPTYYPELPHAVPTPDTFLTDLYDKIGTPQVNNCENLSQLRKWREMVPPLRKILLKHDIKSAAELYLWWKYSYKTSELDIMAYFNWIKSWLHQKQDPVNTAHYTLTYNLAQDDTVRYNVYMSPYSIGVMEFLGLDINLSNTWDMLPFSFVMDWFVNVGEVLHSVDTSNLGSQVSLKSLMYSRKRVVRTEYAASENVIGYIISSYYCRQLQTTLPVDVCSLHFNDPTKHLLDASSLVIANKR